MRLISADSYSFGAVPFAWSGLIDPKLYQRYPWLLPELIVPSPVVIPVLSVSTGRVTVGITTPDYDVTTSSRKKHMKISEPTFGVCITKRSTNVSV